MATTGLNNGTRVTTASATCPQDGNAARTAVGGRDRCAVDGLDGATACRQRQLLQANLEPQRAERRRLLAHHATSIETGVAFPLGLMTHSNNPIQTNDDNLFPGDLNIRLFGVTQNFPWVRRRDPQQPRQSCVRLRQSRPARTRRTSAIPSATAPSPSTGSSTSSCCSASASAGTGNIGGTPPTCPATTERTSSTPSSRSRASTTYGCLLRRVGAGAFADHPEGQGRRLRWLA